MQNFNTTSNNSDVITWNGNGNMSFSQILKQIFNQDFTITALQYRWYEKDRKLLTSKSWVFYPFGFCRKIEPDFIKKNSNYIEIFANQSFVVFVVDKLRVLHYTFSISTITGDRMITQYTKETGKEKHYRYFDFLYFFSMHYPKSWFESLVIFCYL